MQFGVGVPRASLGRKIWHLNNSLGADRAPISYIPVVRSRRRYLFLQPPEQHDDEAVGLTIKILVHVHDFIC